MWQHVFLEFWLVNTWFFAHWRHQRVVTRLENVRQLNIRRGKKLGFLLSHRQPLKHNKTVNDTIDQFKNRIYAPQKLKKDWK